MLTLIRVANYAIIDEIEVELDRGFSVMTGETGAGKSILIDAVALALGDRADASVVRPGARRADISLVFECAPGHPALEWLREHGLDDDRNCCLRRSIAAEGRSRAYVNNQPVTLQDLKSLGSLLIDIHGQHAHQSLLAASAQRALLDASADLEKMAADVASAHRAWRAAIAALRERAEGVADREAKLDLLRFQCRELEELALEPDEIDSLRAERERLSHVDRLIEEIGSAVQALYEGDDGTAQERVAAAAGALDSAAGHDPSLEGLCGRLNGLEIELREIAVDLAHYRDRLEADPERLETVGARLDRAQRLARRHRVREEELPEVLAELTREIAALEAGTSSLEALTAAEKAAESAYLKAATELSKRRQRAAKQLARKVSSQLKELGMPHGELEVAVEPRPPERGDSSGLDDIEFRVQFNPGQPFAPLSRAASGGELSRVSLALEVVTTGASSIPTYIFDEVDAGIGGGTAEIVGRRLKQIAGDRQVLCVTHLPQVASQGNAHYRIVKLTDGRSSRTQIRRLSRDERVEELSRMLGGVEITAATRAHASEMIEQSEAAGG